MSEKVCKKFPQIFFFDVNGSLRVEIETERLFIRSYESDDFENAVALYGDPDITTYFDHGKPRSREEVQSLVEAMGYKYFDRGEPFGLFSLFLKSRSVFVGHADLLPTDEPGTVEVGCILAKEFQKQGLGTEVVKVLIGEYVTELNRRGVHCNGAPIKKIMGTSHPENIASNMMIKKSGLLLEGFKKRFDSPRLWYSRKADSI